MRTARPWLFGALLVACKGPTSAPMPAPSASAKSGSAKGAPCGELGCAQYESVEDAFRDAVAGDVRIIAIGEAHAPKGATVPSSARRFTEMLLPLLAGRASDLLVELMSPPRGCAAEAQDVKKKQEVVTSQQAPTDQNEYVAMGERARALGIVPDLLRPTCADLAAIRDAGQDAIVASLTTIVRLTTNRVESLVDRDGRTPADAGKAVVTYGGAIHNDRLPPPERADWCFGPALDAYVKGQYTEIDLYVPEFMDSSETWTALPWYRYYDRGRLGAKATMFRPRERSFVIIFPESRR